MNIPTLKAIVQSATRIETSDEKLFTLSKIRESWVCKIWVNEGTGTLIFSDVQHAFSLAILDPEFLYLIKK